MDELVERIRRCSYLDPKGGEVCNDCPNREDFYECKQKLALQAADAIEELLQKMQQMPRWIPVKERLPNAGERVLCYCRANIYEVMKMRTDGDWVYDTNHIYMHSFVTHWMPLPEPPKEG